MEPIAGVLTGVGTRNEKVVGSIPTGGSLEPPDVVVPRDDPAAGAACRDRGGLTPCTPR